MSLTTLGPVMESSEQKDHHILVTLDSLLDTRIASVAAHNADLATQLLATGQYQSRRHNQLSRILSGLSQGVYDVLYKERDTYTLKLAVATPIVPMLADLVTRYRSPLDRPVEEMKVILTINAAPYLLSHELKTIIADTVKLATLVDEVRWNFLLPEYLRPEGLVPYHTVVMHDIDEWFTLHGETLARTHGLQETTIYAPEALVDPDRALQPGASAAALRFIAMGAVQIELMPLSMFSIPTMHLGENDDQSRTT